ncbi:MAG: citrate/2-methylcitrate synthase [Clostridium sp.]|nr:citrate/2-methylcitrate synthase [Clostridium sp.]MCM1207938.1 citrate/2-methylcitrate synthase [Ruminococcus sp.]
MAEVNFREIIDEYVRFCNESGKIDLNLYEEYNVKRGLRDSNGRGVLTGLTEVSDVVAFRVDEGERIPIPGELYFQGYEVKKLVAGQKHSLYGFEEATYLLLFGELPTKPQLDSFVEVLGNLRQLPDSFNRDVIMKAPSNDMMNVLQKCVLTLYSYDDNPNDLSIKNVLKQCLRLIAQFPVMAAYGYQAYRHYYLDKSLVIHRPKKELSTAENILRLLRTDGKYTELEAKVLDVCLIIHAEHGGGNNSTFTTHVLSSTGTDTYSAVAASLGSLKGPRHGGANLKVQQMFDDLKSNIKDWENEDEISEYLQGLLDKKGFDKSGLIYGMGHAVYSESDPRAVILKEYAKKLSEEKGLTEEFALYDRVETIAARLIAQHRKTFKTVSANVDFYSGFVYTMLKLPTEIFTPIFAISRISGWSAHRIEELVNNGKIIRPAYKFVGRHKEYIPIEERNW